MMKTFVATRGGVTDVAPVTEQAAYLAASELRCLLTGSYWLQYLHMSSLEKLQHDV